MKNQKTEKKSGFTIFKKCIQAFKGRKFCTSFTMAAKILDEMDVHSIADYDPVHFMCKFSRLVEETITLCIFFSEYQIQDAYFGPPLLSGWSYRIGPVGQLVSQLGRHTWKTAVTIFLLFCMKLGHYKGLKLTEPDFQKKILFG